MAVKSSFKNMTLCLLAICLLCSALLAGVYALTADTIENVKAQKNEQAVKSVLPEYATLEAEKSFNMNGETYKYNRAVDKNGQPVGYAIDVKPLGFGGPIEMKVGFKVDPSTGEVIVWDTKVIKHSETPGLGAKCTESEFSAQFKEFNPSKKALEVKKEGGVDAITASTITSKAYTQGVQTALDVCCAIWQQDQIK